ncbi:hypothetical protein [Bradyrhizobium sp. STM 3561]|uniref:hypothetical protein n=1 Tax=Bradyrhizobium sp. STM 3561 TaxID=578923 RepID=UPI00388EEA73
MAQVVVNRVRRTPICRKLATAAQYLRRPTAAAGPHICPCWQANHQIKGYMVGAETGIFIADVTVSFVVTRFSQHVDWRNGLQGRVRRVECNSCDLPVQNVWVRERASD